MFHPDVVDISLGAVLGALSDPIHRDVLRRIAEEGPFYCSGLAYNVVKSTLSHHPRTLRLFELMHTEVLGRRHRVIRRDRAIKRRFPGLLKAVGLPPGRGCWEEQEIARPGTIRRGARSGGRWQVQPEGRVPRLL